MIRRLRQVVIAGGAVLILSSCSPREPVKSTGPPALVNSNVAESTSSSISDTWSAATLDAWIKDDKELARAWKKFERSQKYRLAQPTETKNNPFLIWWGAEAYQGASFLIAIVVDGSRSDANRYGLVVVAAPDSENRKYKTYWVTQEENLQDCEISPASGSVYFTCVRADGAEETRSLAWYRSRREFRLKPVRAPM